MKQAVCSGVDESFIPRLMSTWVRTVFLGGYILLACWSLFYGAGSVASLAFFHLSFLLLVVLAFLRPLSQGYCFLVFFLFLGFWLKWLVHEVFDYPFVEPVGGYLGEPEQVDLALGIASFAALGVAASRLLQFYLAKVHSIGGRERASDSYPPVYGRFFVLVWAILVPFALALYFLNYHFAFFQVGVNARLVLPFGINAIISWAVYCGMPMFFVLVLDWEIARRPERYWSIVFGVCLFALVMSVSMASRAVLPFLYLAVGVSLYFHKRDYLAKMIASWRWRLPLVMSFFFVLALFLVSVFRLDAYQPPQTVVVPEGNSSQERVVLQAEREVQSSARYEGMFFQVLRLSVDRWIGMEGALAVASSDEPSMSLLIAGITESPSNGVDAVYQRIAGSFYEHQADFTFLTLPGAAAVLFYGGSLLIVFLGMMFLASVVYIVEKFSLSMSGSRLLSSWVALLLANSVCQMNFPYLWGVFVLECMVALLALGIGRVLFIRESAYD
ncbi:hypothetical protein LF844_09415 [Metapseudomonas lalkuanensis]|uniref:hypothetical protein n=1 Tax=Metapseudomonas lalkuanensis TaxID=2604832 RepID=UPI001CF43B73|nr:hypothetical protein [Pseudomonas lalkuanensis]UCP00017.1 hypothetical protein LF844_09415 [Pseudomonas lalkuanensis]